MTFEEWLILVTEAADALAPPNRANRRRCAALAKRFPAVARFARRLAAPPLSWENLFSVMMIHWHQMPARFDGGKATSTVDDAT